MRRRLLRGLTKTQSVVVYVLPPLHCVSLARSPQLISALFRVLYSPPPPLGGGFVTLEHQRHL